MKKSKQTDIPLHSGELRAQSGIHMKRFDIANGVPATEKGRAVEAHRDDHFIFIVQEEGESRLMLDFAEVTLDGPVLFFIIPGQVHSYRAVKNFKGWFVALETALVGERFLPVFQERRFCSQVVANTDQRLIEMSLRLLHAYLLDVPPAGRSPLLLENMIHAFTGLVAGCYSKSGEANQAAPALRAGQLVMKFRKLVARNYISEKSPAAYAGKLNLSLSYLNETVKKQTGFPVSYWIREQVLLESRRLLCYTALDVKEIAYRLGYSDHAYFSRFFRKEAGQTALEFRRSYRVLSNHSV